MNRKVLFFDVETNGFFGSSVLSFSAILVNFRKEDNTVKYSIIDKLDRYYYPIEEYNKGATDVNGLTRDVIDEKRKDVKYSETFKGDDEIIELLNKADLYVAHNIKFDRSFMPLSLENEKQFCTMHENTNICKLPNPNKRYGGYKWPKLMECVEHYNIPYDPNQLHNSLYDVEMTIEVFLSMMKNNTLYNKIDKFLFGDIGDEEDINNDVFADIYMSKTYYKN